MYGWVSFLEGNLKLKAHQYGFRKRRSCVTNLLEYIDKISTLLDQGHSVDVAYYDFSKAFDTVSHSRLSDRLEQIGIIGNLKRWIMAWLTNRRQRVVIDGDMSAWISVLSGVPQGSVLGPALFIIFVNNIADETLNEIFAFADDLKLVSQADSVLDRSVMQTDVNTLNSWARTWKMKFNAKKCSVMHFGNRNPQHTYTLGEEQLAASSCEKDLGILIQSNLKSDQHVKKVAQKCYQILGQINRSFKFKTPEIMLKLYQTYVTPHMDYGVTVWCPSTQRDIDVLENVQRRFTRMVLGLKGLEYWERCTVLGLNTLQNRRRKLDLIQCFRVLRGTDDIRENMFIKVKDTHNRETRQSMKDNLAKEKNKLDLRKNFFSQRVISDWNNLPQWLKETRSLSKFKSLLDELI